MVSALLGLGLLAVVLGLVVLVAKLLIFILLKITGIHGRRRWQQPYRHTPG